RFATLYAIFVFSFYIFDLYEPRHWRSSLFSPLKIVFASFNAAILLFSWFYFIATETGGVYGRGVLLGAISGFTIYSLAFRYFVDRSQKRRARRTQWLLVGNEKSYQSLGKEWPRLHLGTQLQWKDRDELLANIDSLEYQLNSEDELSR